jgi:hypothetical protein
MGKSCAQFNVPNDSEAEINEIHSAIQTVSSQTGVDNRFVLAIIMQESGGCVRVPTTNFGVRNPGLMQDHNGQGTCNSDTTKKVSNPCPQSEVTQMVKDGS